MAEELETVAEEISGAGSEPVAAASRSLEDLTVEELMELAPKAVRPDWMVTRYPVSMEEYGALKEAADEAEPEPEQPGEALAVKDTTPVDTDIEAEELEAPEG